MKSFLEAREPIQKRIDGFPIIAPRDVTARIQKCRVLIAHIVCELAEERLGA